jgi:hypothetical protein
MDERMLKGNQMLRQNRELNDLKPLFHPNWKSFPLLSIDFRYLFVWFRTLNHHPSDLIIIIYFKFNMRYYNS